MSVRIGIAEAAADTGGGDQTITCSRSIGTPQAALFIVTRASAIGTTHGHAIMSIGATDGTRQRVVACASTTNESLSDAARRGATDEVIMMLHTAGGGLVLAEANFKNWVTNGVTITWGDTPDVTYRIVVVLFAGLEDAYVGDVLSSATLDGEVDVTDPGFEPDQLVCMSNSADLDDTARVGSRISMGLVDNDGSAYPQACANHWVGDGYAVSSVVALTHDDRVLRNITGTTNGGSVEIGGFDGSGFSAFTRDSAEANRFAYLALKYTSDDSLGHWVSDEMLSRTGVGDKSYSDTGFTPQFVLWLPSMCQSDNSRETDGDGGVFGVCVLTTDEEYSACICDEDNVSTTNTGSRVENKALYLLKHDKTEAFVGTFVSFQGSGWSVNMTKSQVFQRRFAALAVEKDTGVAGSLVNRPTRLAGLVDGGLVG